MVYVSYKMYEDNIVRSVLCGKIIAHIDQTYGFFSLPSFLICCADNRLELPRFPPSTLSSEDVEEVLEFVVAEEFDLRNL